MRDHISLLTCKVVKYNPIRIYYNADVFGSQVPRGFTERLNRRGEREKQTKEWQMEKKYDRTTIDDTQSMVIVCCVSVTKEKKKKNEKRKTSKRSSSKKFHFFSIQVKV